MLFVKQFMPCLILLATATAEAQNYRGSTAVRHYINISLGGGETNTISRPAEQLVLHDMAGGEAELHLSYELNYKRFFVNIGLGTDYSLTRQLLDEYVVAVPRIARDGLDENYEFVFTDWRSSMREVHFVVPLQLGVWVHPLVYTAVGATLMLPAMQWHNENTMMLTQGDQTERHVEPFRNDPYNGYYSNAGYAVNSRSQSGISFMSLQAEVGARIPLHASRVGLRAGLYAGYALPLQKPEITMLADVSNVDIAPMSQSEKQMRQSLVLNNVQNSNALEQLSGRLQVGVRLTLQLNVTPDRSVCHCIED